MGLEIFDASMRSLERGMEKSIKIQSVIAHNIANANTEDFRALRFDEELNRAVERLENPKVALEEEMAALTENSLKYSAYIKLLASKLNILRTVVTQGRR